MKLERGRVGQIGTEMDRGLRRTEDTERDRGCNRERVLRGKEGLRGTDPERLIRRGG